MRSTKPIEDRDLYKFALIVSILKGLQHQTAPTEFLAYCWLYLKNPKRFAKAQPSETNAWAERYPDCIKEDESLEDVLSTLCIAHVIVPKTLPSYESAVSLIGGNLDKLDKQQLEDIKMDAMYARYFAGGFMQYLKIKNQMRPNVHNNQNNNRRSNG